ncbi:MAG: extracellular solute-binding protein [Rhodospirillales bacterium]
MLRISLLATLALLLGASIAWAQKPTVTFYNWAGYVPAELIKGFEKSSGLKVAYPTFESNEILDARLRDGKAEFDVVGPRAAPFLAAQVPEGFYQPLDRGKLAHYGNLDPVILKLLEKYDPGNLHAVPWMWGTIGIGYNVERMKRLLSDMPPDTLRLIFDPQIVSKFKDCGVMVLDSPAEMIPAALLYLGLDPDSKSEADLIKAVDAIKAVRPFIRKFASSDFVNQLNQGAICLAFGYSGDIHEARQRSDQAKGRGRITIGYVVPKEGALVWIDTLAIPANAPNADSAYKLIDYLLDAKVAAASANQLRYASGNAAARPFLDAGLSGDAGLYPPSDVMAKLYTVSPAERRYQLQRQKLWNGIKGNK